MRVNKLLKRISAGLLAALTVVSLVPQGEGLTSSSTVSAANIASGIEGTLGSVNINGCDTMYDYIKHNFTYTDQMTVKDYKTARSASYDRNETSTGKNSVDYLLQSVEWTDVDNGEALLSVAGKDTTDSKAVFIFTSCTGHYNAWNNNGSSLGDVGLCVRVVRQDILDLLSKYDSVDVMMLNNDLGQSDTVWIPSNGSVGGYSAGNYNEWPARSEYGYTGVPYSGRNNSLLIQAYANNGLTQYGGINPYVTFSASDYKSKTELEDAINAYLWSQHWSWGHHQVDDVMTALKIYLYGADSSAKTWCNKIATGFQKNSITAMGAVNANGTIGANVWESRAYNTNPEYITPIKSNITYGSAVGNAAWNAYALDILHKPDSYFTEANLVNLPTSIYVAGDTGTGGVNDYINRYGYNRTYIDTLASVWDDQDAYFSLGSVSTMGLYYYGSPNDPISAFYSPSAYRNNGYKPFGQVANNTIGGHKIKYFGYNQSFFALGIKMPEKQLSFDIPIGDAWQVDKNNLPKVNIVYTSPWGGGTGNTGYQTTDVSGKKLEAKMSIDSNNVIHITTNTYVKGAEISIQIPLKYSANGVQSAKQLRVGEDGKVYTDGKSGTPVADTYVISMTAGDTKLHVGPDILGDLDTSLSIYMPSSDLMDVQVNLHWMNDSDTIKGMLGDTSVRGNATALIGSDALVGTMLGKQSDDDEKAGGIGTSVVAMNFADANGSVGTIASSYTDSDGITKQLSNDSVDVHLRTKNGAPDLWTDAKDEAGENNVVTYMMFNVPRFGHPTANTYDANGNVTSVTDLASGVVPRYYYVEDVVNVPAGYTAYNITNMASSDLEKLQKTTGSDTENPMTYNKALYYAYTVTPPSDWNSSSKVTYTIDCYVALDIKSLKMTVEHYQEQLTGDGYTPSTNKQYKLESSIDSYEAITSVYSPEVKTYAGYDSPDRQSMTVTVTGDHVIKYYYDLHYYDINVDTQGGEWYEEQDDGTWNAISEPPAHYTILTPTFTLPRPDKVGFDFEGYTGTGLTKPTLDVTIPKGTTGDKDYKANWIAQAYDVEVPVSLIFSASYDGVMKGAFDQNGSGKVADTGFLLNNSKFPVQVTHITYNNDSVYTMSDVKSDKPNIMNWRLDATNPDTLRPEDRTYNVWATALDDTVNVSDCETYWMAQNSDGKVILDSDQAWYRNDVPDIKDTTKIGNIVWTFGIGHRNVVERPIVAAK